MCEVVVVLVAVVEVVADDCGWVPSVVLVIVELQRMVSGVGRVGVWW
jgi:hypothetical protein